jgi:large subunit ribosomal protein L4e
VSELPQVPLVIANDVQSLEKTKQAVSVLKAVGAYDDVEKCQASKQLRTGKGKWRNRRHTMRRGPLVCYKQDSGLVKAFRNLPGVELCPVESLNLLQLAPGGHVGRFIVWTEDAFKALDGLFGSETAPADASMKKRRAAPYVMPRHKMLNADVARLINSDEVQSAVRAVRPACKRRTAKKNPLTNIQQLFKMNPYAKTAKRQATIYAAARQQIKAAKKK